VRFLRIPARTDVPNDCCLTRCVERGRSCQAMPVDAKLLADSLDTWMKFWDSNIRNSQRGK
jgi:hypothetical protein